MLVTQILTHIQDTLSKTLQQYKSVNPQYTIQLQTPINEPATMQVSRMGAVIAAIADQYQILESVFFDIDGRTMLFNGVNSPATGAQLDAIGTLVNLSRNGLGDKEYYIFIVATIAKNFSDTTIDAVLNAANLLFQVSGNLIGFDLYPAQYAVQVPNTSTLDPSLYIQVANILQAILGAGIGLGFISTYPTNGNGPFRCSYVGGPQIGGGCGDLNNPSIGGGMAGNIYNNPGV